MAVVKPDFYLVCGLSGVGKTTFSKKYAKNTGLRYLGADEFYAKVNGSEHIHTNKFEVWIELFKAIHECEQAGIGCVVDSNALSASGRDEFINWFPGFNHHIIFIDADERLRQTNNLSRERKIPESIMMSMRSKLEHPVWNTMDKRWQSLTCIHNSNNHFLVVDVKGKPSYTSVKSLVW